MRRALAARLPGAAALALAALVLSVLIVAGGACSGRDERSPLTRPAPTDTADQALMVALAQAKNLHHVADVHQADGNLDAAGSALGDILTLPFPAGAPEADDIRLDARARLAKLHLGRGQLTEARRVVDEGLRGAPRRSFFLANLHTVSGEVHEAEARSASATNAEAARAHRRAALEAYESALRINESIQKELFEEARP